MSYRTAVHYSHQVLGLASKATKYIRDLFDAPDNEVESIRLRTTQSELMIAQQAILLLYAPITKRMKSGASASAGAGAEGEKKEGESLGPKSQDLPHHY